MELLIEDQVQEIAKETAPVQQETQQIILLSRLSRQDKRKDRVEDSALLQHMLQEPAGTSTQEQDKEDEPQRPSLQESLQATIAHLRNIQYHHLHDQEELQLAKAQSLAMATVNDELLQKVQDLQTQLAIANSLVDAERSRHQGLIKANQELMNRLKDKEIKAKDQELQRLQINLALEIANQRRKDAEELLEKFLINPTSEASSST